MPARIVVYCLLMCALQLPRFVGGVGYFDEYYGVGVLCVCVVCQCVCVGGVSVCVCMCVGVGGCDRC